MNAPFASCWESLCRGGSNKNSWKSNEVRIKHGIGFEIADWMTTIHRFVEERKRKEADNFAEGTVSLVQTLYWGSCRVIRTYREEEAISAIAVIGFISDMKYQRQRNQ
ncbi:uncharacterized protein LOC122537381 [Frieseomelitta varia]|uniref:uncharacterized protein LOC122537381 n=1 Tax=Frieseomelitta varia TaxID=561572 RepID=UPI001CB6AB28|nr:uncharacterized protein LOC122537381 [Frieseomelitta varia]